MRLKIHPGDKPSFEHMLEGKSQLIGRYFKAAIKLPDPSLSRKHARFFRRDDHWFLEDLGSQNGTLVNGRRISSPVPIQEGDQLTVGNTEIIVLGPKKSLAQDAIESGSSGVYRSAAEVLAGTTSSGVRFAAASHFELRRLAQQLAVLNEAHQSLSGPMTIEQALEMIIDKLFEYLEPEEGAIYLIGDDTDLECRVSRSRGGSAVEPLHSQHLVEQVIEKGMAAVVLDASIDERFHEAASIISRGVRSLVAAPMMAPEGPVGMIVLSSSLRARQFNEADMELLTSMASVAAMKVVNERLTNEVLLRQKLEQELALARKIQMTLLPVSTPKMTGWETHGTNTPSRGVSGDFFKVVESQDRQRGVVLIADVSGKGFAAALLTASLEALLMLPIETGMAPADICTVVSRQLHERTTSERFTTAVISVFDRLTGEVAFASAGHNPALHVTRDGKYRWLPATGIPLGLMRDAAYEEIEVQMGRGDLLVLYTDGITEARDDDLNEYGEDRLLQLVLEHRSQSAQLITAALERSVEDFATENSFDDDRTILILKRVSGQDP